MFESNSRYAKSPIAEVEAGPGVIAKVVKLRRLPFVAGNPGEIKGSDRLDILAHRRFNDGTRYWHIADANSELEANDLIGPPPPENPLAKRGTAVINVPGN